MFFSVFNFPFLCRPLILVYLRENINGYLHMQCLNCSNACGDGTITSLETSPEIDQRRCNLGSGTYLSKSQSMISGHPVQLAIVPCHMG